MLGLFLLVQIGKKYNLARDGLYDLAFYTIIIGLVFDRLYYVVYAWEFYRNNLIDIFKIWQGGLAIHGGIIGGSLVLIYFAGNKKHLLWRAVNEKVSNFKKTEQFAVRLGMIADLVILALLAGLMIGRWGNYFNQELFGLPTNLPWGIPIAPANRPAEFINNQYFHPTFLYESLFDGIVLIGLIGWHRRRWRGKEIKFKSYGDIFLAGLTVYSGGRFLNEFLRQDYSVYVLNWRAAQIASAAIIIWCGILFVLKSRMWYNKNN